MRDFEPPGCHAGVDKLSARIQTPCGKQGTFAHPSLPRGERRARVVCWEVRCDRRGARMQRRGSDAVANIKYRHVADRKVTTNPHHDIELQSEVYVRAIYYATAQ